MYLSSQLLNSNPIPILTYMEAIFISDNLEEEKNGESEYGEEGSEYVRIRLPNRSKGEMFAVADQLVGGSRVRVVCEDGKSRMGRIRGRIKKRKWIRTGNLLIVRPWDFQDDKADIIYSYTPTQASNLARRHKIPDSINVF